MCDYLTKKWDSTWDHACCTCIHGIKVTKLARKNPKKTKIICQLVHEVYVFVFEIEEKYSTFSLSKSIYRKIALPNSILHPDQTFEKARAEKRIKRNGNSEAKCVRNLSLWALFWHGNKHRRINYACVKWCNERKHSFRLALISGYWHRHFFHGSYGPTNSKLLNLLFYCIILSKRTFSTSIWSLQNNIVTLWMPKYSLWWILSRKNAFKIFQQFVEHRVGRV